ncbi:MAG: hypothetical protein SAK29_31165 [Scytonema sp. PMC 1069.18]|nr:hypothetical protein [Scytonema sp. PMC 1069.18]MEC4879803.1 hypothetical protein [Scytonema sp. PMC 1070.18]
MSESIENWIKALPKRPTPTYNQRYQFQIKYCGAEEIQLLDGGEQIWADGINTQIGCVHS